MPLKVFLPRSLMTHFLLNPVNTFEFFFNYLTFQKHLALLMITLFWKQCHPLAWKTLCCYVLRSLKTDCLVSVLTLISCMTLGSHSASLGFSFLITLSCSVVSNSFPPQGLQPARLLCPWNSPGKNTSVGSHSLLQGIFPTQGSNPWEIFTVLTVFFAV